MKWFRVYDDLIDDPKILRLSVEMRWFFIGILCISSRQADRGSLPELTDIALHLRVSASKASRVIGTLIQSGLIEEDVETKRLVVHGWASRQFKSDDITARTARFKSKTKERSQERSQERHGNAPDTDTDTDQIQRQNNTPPLPPATGGGACEPFECPTEDRPRSGRAEPERERVVRIADELSAGALGRWAHDRMTLGDPPAWVESAIREAIDSGKRSTQYIAGILGRYAREKGPSGPPADARASPRTRPKSEKQQWRETVASKLAEAKSRGIVIDDEVPA